ncbi:MAG: glycerophosphodiester phosphodiesterase [Alphaproteobacteria bacterium]|nr:glycerophosphodiester phosphodiesterase [Alphaproteobacteria bacterium]
MRVTVLIACLLSFPACAFDIEGHRGTRGHMPENTLPAFAKALSIGVTTLELDLGITKDDVVVVAHDRRLNPDITRGPDGEWLTPPAPRVRELTLAELMRHDVGAIRPGIDYARTFASQTAIPGTRMPTLDQVFGLARRAGNATVRFDIETKLSPLAPDDTLAPEAFVRQAIAAIDKAGMRSRTTLQSFDWRTLAVAARLAPELARSYLTLERGNGDNVWKGRGKSPWTGLDAADHGNSTPRLVHAAGGRIWSAFHRDLTATALAEAKALGIKVLAWTVNEPADMARLVEMGVDGIITDYPDRLRDVLAAKGMALPAATPVEP